MAAYRAIADSIKLLSLDHGPLSMRVSYRMAKRGSAQRDFTVTVSQDHVKGAWSGGADDDFPFLVVGRRPPTTERFPKCVVWHDVDDFRDHALVRIVNGLNGWSPVSVSIVDASDETIVWEEGDGGEEDDEEDEYMTDEGSSGEDEDEDEGEDGGGEGDEDEEWRPRKRGCSC